MLSSQSILPLNIFLEYYVFEVWIETQKNLFTFLLSIGEITAKYRAGTVLRILSSSPLFSVFCMISLVSESTEVFQSLNQFHKLAKEVNKYI